MKELIELATEMFNLNPTGFVSGSVALKMQNLAIRREPQDLDFIFEKQVELNMPDGYYLDEDDSDYPDDCTFIRETWVHKTRPKIDVIFPRDENETVKIFNADGHFCFHFDEEKPKFRMVEKHSILEFKLLYSFDLDSSTFAKHREDLIHLLLPYTDYAKKGSK